MNSDGDALLRAILMRPAEDTPRLAYADWLDEHGESERAEFIRVQVEFERLRDVIRPGIEGPVFAEDFELVSEMARDWSRKMRLAGRERELLTADRRREWARVPCPNPQCVLGETSPQVCCRTCDGWHEDLFECGGTKQGFRRGFVERVDVPALSWLFERHGVSYGRSDSQQAWRVTDWALAVASAHPVTEFAFPFPELVFVGEGEVAAESGDLPKPLYELLCCDRRARHGLAVFADEPELMNALATAAADWVRAAVLKAWGQEVRT